MKVKTFSINTTAGKLWGLCHASDGQVCYSAPAKWKTEKGAISFAKRNGWEVVR